MYNLNTFRQSMPFVKSFSGLELMVNIIFCLRSSDDSVKNNYWFFNNVSVTECLEYPDFSCVVLYGHVIIGFAFMVPDVSYNEAYISYLFTHPEWRGAGIAKFMLYHLIQVSAESLAVMRKL
jgi:GNAT superfamily N-acetyltransferase